MSPAFPNAKKGRRRYTVAQREQALLAVVMNGGRILETGRQLGINGETLRKWVAWQRPHYEELQRKHGPELEARAVSGLQAFINNAEEAKAAALAAVVDGLSQDALDLTAWAERVRADPLANERAPVPRIKDPAKALQHVAVAQGISVQKILELTGRPTQTVQHTSINDSLARLRALGAQITVEGAAVEIPQALELSTSTVDSVDHVPVASDDGTQ